MDLFRWLRKLMQWFLGLFRKPAEKRQVPVPQESGTGAPGIAFSPVSIPTLDARVDYLAVEAYAPGDIVTIPFGPEDREIFGIVEKLQVYSYLKTPLPMWKMKYILGKAPQAIVEEYHRLKKD